MRDRIATYWSNLCQSQGHTGWQVPWAYRYDQPLRLKGVRRALSRAGIDPKSLNVLDVGCGVGDLVWGLAKSGASVTGIDISDEVIEKAQERLGEDADITLLSGSIEEMGFPPASFDLVTSVTVLQHIVLERNFEQAVQNMVDVIRPGGYILILENAPFAVTESFPRPEMILRPRKDWIQAFEARCCSLVYEHAHPIWGISLLFMLQRWSQTLLYWMRPSRRCGTRAAIVNSQRRVPTTSFLARRYSTFAKLVLSVFYPIEHWFFLAPPRKYAALVYMIFRKETG